MASIKNPKRAFLWVTGSLFLSIAMIVFAFFLVANITDSGQEPVYYVDSYDALKADLKVDAPRIRFFDLSRYDDIDTFKYSIQYTGKGDMRRNDSYSICSYGSETPSAQFAEDAKNAGVNTVLSRIELSCEKYYFNKHGECARIDNLAFNGKIADTSIQLSSWETVLGETDRERESFGPGDFYGNHSVRFVVGRYHYYIIVSYGIPASTAEEDAAVIRKQAEEEALALARSVIEQ